MADVISRLKLESGEFDSKVKRATQGLLQMEQECRRVNGTLSVLEKDQKLYVQSLGNMQTVSNTTRGKINELTQAYIELSMQFRRLTDEEKQGDFGKALTSSLVQIKDRIKELKDGLADVNSELSDANKEVKNGEFFDASRWNNALSVFGGNMLTKAFDLATGAVSSFVDTIKDAAAEGIEMAQAGEGVRLAFERLNRADLLDNLRQATHGTVNDIELMKQAVKFNDFKLNLNEMGTLLAFAQQKAKDTGQSVDYMVDSIVTGLGRQSVMILDNLGISASEIKNRMKDTGDMTSAVAAIIRDQMSQAGDYVETAADRAARANVELQNAMEELGRTLIPLQEQGVDVFNAIEISALKLLNDSIKPMVPVLIDMKDNLSGIYDSISDSSVWQAYATGVGYVTSAALKAISPLARMWGYLKGMAGDGTNVASEGAGIGAAIAPPNMLDEVVVTPRGNKNDTKTTTKEVKDGFQEIIGLIPSAEEAVKSLQEQIRTSWDEGEISRLTVQLRAAEAELQRLKDIGNEGGVEAFMGLFGINTSNFDSIGAELVDKMRQSMSSAIMEKNDNMLADAMKLAITAGIDATDFSEAAMAIKRKIAEGGGITDEDWQNFINQLNEKIENSDLKLRINLGSGNITNGTGDKAREENNIKEISTKLSQVGSGLSMVGSGLKNLGVELPKGVEDIINIVQSVSSVINGVQTLITALVGTSLTANTTAVIANTAALYANTSTNFLPLAGGGIAHAAGGLFSGNFMSMDQVPVMVNSGELILNRAQQGNLASQLEGGGLGTLHIEGLVEGENLRLVLTDLADRTGNEALRAAMG